MILHFFWLIWVRERRRQRRFVLFRFRLKSVEEIELDVESDGWIRWLNQRLNQMVGNESKMNRWANGRFNTKKTVFLVIDMCGQLKMKLKQKEKRWPLWRLTCSTWSSIVNAFLGWSPAIWPLTNLVVRWLFADCRFISLRLSVLSDRITVDNLD